MAELSSARQALEGAAMVPGNEETRAALQNPERRPPCLRDPIPPDILNAAPVGPLVLDAENFARNMRSAKRGAKGGPSGMTADNLRLILESKIDTRASCGGPGPCQGASSSRRGGSASNGPHRGFAEARGLVFAALCAETSCEGWWLEPLHRRSRMRFWKQRLRSSTRWVQRRESVAHAIQSFTDMDSRATVLSIDGIFAFDLISKGCHVGRHGPNQGR